MNSTETATPFLSPLQPRSKGAHAVSVKFMENTLASIKGQDASQLACPWFLCTHCGMVDRDMRRMRVGHECGSCGRSSEGGRLYFPITIHILVDLVHQAYHSDAPVGPIHGPQTGAVGTIVFFCALREALLAQFLKEHMEAQQLPQGIISRLLNDNKLANQRFGRLFKSVIGESWRAAIEEVAIEGCSFAAVSELMKVASEVRNDFMHTGAAWEATDELATDCVNSLPLLTHLFAELHNHYVRPIQHKI